jgi:hypothetical protein
MRPGYGKAIEITEYDFQKDVATLNHVPVVRFKQANILGQKNPTLGNSVNTAVLSLRSGLEYQRLALEIPDTIDFLLQDLASATAVGLPLVQGSAYGAIAAAGTTQGASTLLNKQVAAVTAASGSAVGVLLPVGPPLYVQWVINNSTQTLSIFPSSGDTIFGSALNAAVTLAPGGKACFYTKSTYVAASATLGIWYQIQ